jgi:hypothetical protein
MTDNEFDRMARAWLDDGPNRVADRVLQSALDEIHVTRQRRAWWPTRRLSSMSNAIRLAAGAAAIVVATVVGISLLSPGSGGIGGRGGAPTPTATPSPTASPRPTSAEREFVLTFGVDQPYRLHLTAPASWSGNNLDFVMQKHGGALPNGMAIATWIVGNVYRDGCHWAGTLFDPPVGPTVDDLATAISGLKDRETTTPVDVTVDGFAGKELEMTIPDVDFSACDEGQFRSWTDPSGGPRYHQGPGEQSRILILDVDGTRVLVFGRSFPDTSAADRAELNAILDSMQIEAIASPSASPSGAPSATPLTVPSAVPTAAP